MNMVEEGIIVKSFERAGFTDIVMKSYKCPLTPFSQDPHLKEVGLYARSAMEEGMEGAYSSIHPYSITNIKRKRN